MKTNSYFKIAAMTLLSGLIACEKEEPAVPVTVNFTNTTAAISASASEAQITITLSRAAEVAGDLQVNIAAGALLYGESADFYTVPAATTDGAITIGLAVGATEASFVVRAGSGLNIQEDLTLSLTLVSTSTDYVVGSQASATVSFSENFVAQSGMLELNAGGAAFGYQAFADLSKLAQSTVDKYSWDLGFYSGSEKRVIVNSSAYTMARPLEKTDLNAVSAEDTVGFAAQMVVPQYDPTVGASAWVDAQTGDLSATAFGDLATAETLAKVYIIRRTGEGRTWKKVKVFATANGYTLQYADIAATSFESATIVPDAEYNFTFRDLDNGAVQVEPKKANWDIMYSSYVNRFPFGGSTIPYGYNDYIIINRHQTEVAQVSITETVTYAGFTLSNAQSLTLNNAINAVGASWRSGGGPNAAPALYEDRFYILRDSEGHYYKLKFTSMTSTTGERGYASIQFDLLQ